MPQIKLDCGQGGHQLGKSKVCNKYNVMFLPSGISLALLFLFSWAALLFMKHCDLSVVQKVIYMDTTSNKEASKEFHLNPSTRNY